jgi:hypothetical protein
MAHPGYNAWTSLAIIASQKYVVLNLSPGLNYSITNGLFKDQRKMSISFSLASLWSRQTGRSWWDTNQISIWEQLWYNDESSSVITRAKPKVSCIWSRSSNSPHIMTLSSFKWHVSLYGTQRKWADFKPRELRKWCRIPLELTLKVSAIISNTSTSRMEW